MRDLVRIAADLAPKLRSLHAVSIAARHGRITALHDRIQSHASRPRASTTPRTGLHLGPISMAIRNTYPMRPKHHAGRQSIAHNMHANSPIPSLPNPSSIGARPVQQGPQSPTHAIRPYSKYLQQCNFNKQQQQSLHPSTQEPRQHPARRWTPQHTLSPPETLASTTLTTTCDNSTQST